MKKRILSLFLGLCTASGLAGELPVFDFTNRTTAQAWRAEHDINVLEPTPQGLRVSIAAADPYLSGPACDLPVGTNLWLHLRLKSQQGGLAQVFYFRTSPVEERSVRFDVPAGQWFEAKVPLPALGPGYRFRIDPPGDAGVCLLGKLSFSERIQFRAPNWPKPEATVAGAKALRVQSGALELRHNQDGFGRFEIRVHGQPFAVGNPQSLVGYVENGGPRWLSLAGSAGREFTLTKRNSSLVAVLKRRDPDGAQWVLQQVFSPAKSGTIDIETRVTVDQDRTILYLPMFTVLPGTGSFGTNKSQGLLAGLEYLENEPSSSEADLIGPASNRRVPNNLKLTFPLMAIQAEGRYLGLIWDAKPQYCALFDSPDRCFNSGGHLMGILFPGSYGENREEGSLLPYDGVTLSANNPLVMRATLIGDRGSSIVPAVQEYTKSRGLPNLPKPGLDAQQYFELAAHGWLDSEIRQGNKYRHAAWPGFGAQPAADAALWMDWLAAKTKDPALDARLDRAAVEALAGVPSAEYNSAAVGHVRYPLPALRFGFVEQNAEQATQTGRALLSRFQPDGSVLYQPRPGGVDYGKTHSSREANGLAANLVCGLLEAAAFSGDRDLLGRAIGHLHALDKFKDTVPRGAQTWEVPLHTPDILASAYLVRAYTLGYELTGENALLDQAVYWAWTGVPFVYLTPPAPQPVGLYATIPVFGATGWTAPVWIGLPVQWCGLVYADALYRLARYDPAGPWRQLADGVALSGVQQTYPMSNKSLQGLLPDSFNLPNQSRNPPPINPATVQAVAIRAYGEPAPYSFQSLRQHHLLIHAPGELRSVSEQSDHVHFTVVPWSRQPSFVLVNGFRQPPRVKLDGKLIKLDSPNAYDSTHGRLILQIQNQASLQIFFH